MLRKLVAVCFVVLLVFAAGSASAMMMGGGKGKSEADKGMMAGDGMAGHFLHMAQQLDLTDAQKKDIAAIHFAFKKDSIRKKADMDVAEVELHEIQSKDPVNMEEAEKKIRAAAAFRADLELMHLKMKEAVKAKLTPEQREKLEKNMAEKQHDKAEDMGGMGMMEDKKSAKMKMKKKCMDDSENSTGAEEKAGEGNATDKEEKSEHSSHQ